MKKIFLFTAIAFLTLSSCKKEGTTLAKDQALAQSQAQTNASSSGPAVPFRDTFIVKWDGTQVYNKCTNEFTTVYGSEVVLVHGVYNGNNSTFTANVHFQNGFRAVGESGRQYVLEEALVYQEKNFSNGVFTAKLKASLRWLTKGGGNNLIWPQTFYYKVDADGNVTFIKDPVNEMYCQ